MPNKILLDSSILVEYRKGTHTDLLDAILLNFDWVPVITQTVVSEYLFHHLAIFSGKAPLTIKMAKEVSHYLKLGDPFLFLSQFEYLIDSPRLLKLAVEYMGKYNLLPNDALILGNAKSHQIAALASFDPDFSYPCQEEGIRLVDNVNRFKNIDEPPSIWESLVNEP